MNRAPKFKVFKDSKELMYFAHKFIVDERLSSLKKDVNACLEKDCAFPALLYCFSVIDLLGALYKGRASAAAHTRDNFKEYAVRFMKNTHTNYTSEQIDLLQNIFRHKIAHLAQPKLVIKSNSKYVAWRYEYPGTANHLKIEPYQYTQIKTLLTPKPIYYDHLFTISITKLMYDTIDSVVRQPDGYLIKLQNNYKNLQSKFNDAVHQIYDSEVS